MEIRFEFHGVASRVNGSNCLPKIHVVNPLIKDQVLAQIYDSLRLATLSKSNLIDHIYLLKNLISKVAFVIERI